MLNENDKGYQPHCMLAHDLINRLSVVVGYCDLLSDETPEDSACRRRLLAIREIAQSAAKDLGEHQCRLELLMRENESELRSA